MEQKLGIATTVPAEFAGDMLRKSGGRFFTVKFKRRNPKKMKDGSTSYDRVLTGRVGVKSHLKGGDAAYSFTEKNLVSVWDVTINGYRCVPVENIEWVHMQKKFFKVSDEGRVI